MNIRVETAGANDGAAIGAILSDWIDETPWMPRIHTKSQDIAHGDWLAELCDVNVVREQDQVAGFLARQDKEIQALYVRGSSRWSGIGSALIAQAKLETDMLGLWTFQANLPAQQFYKGRGFVEDQRSDGSANDEKLPDIHLIWQKGRI